MDHQVPQLYQYLQILWTAPEQTSKKNDSNRKKV